MFGVISTPKMELKFSVQNNPFSGVILTLLVGVILNPISV